MPVNDVSAPIVTVFALIGSPLMWIELVGDVKSIADEVDIETWVSGSVTVV